jgi:site-specific recombinase XerD
MNLGYDDGIALLKQCWLNNGQSLSPAKLAALNALRSYLENRNANYSHEEALCWLCTNKDTWTNQHFFKNRRAVFELNDVMLYGEVIGNYQYYITPFDLLPDCWKSLLLRYKEMLLTKRKRRATRDQITNCTDFATFITNLGLTSPTEITGTVITQYFDHAVSQGDKFVCIYSVRYFLEYLEIRGYIPSHRSLILTAPLQAEAAKFALCEIEMKTISESNLTLCDVRYSPDDFWKKSHSMVDALEKDFKYEANGLRNNYLAHLQMFYIFASECHFDYTPYVACAWLEKMSNFGDSKSITMRYRCLTVFKSFVTTGELVILDVIADPGMSKELASWRKDLMNDFLSSCRNEGLAINTINRHRSACVSFLLYSQNEGIANAGQNSPKLIKAYNVATAKASSNGKNNYASSIRRFLSYLAFKGIVKENLTLSLPSQCGQSRKIVDILNEDEIQSIYNYRNNSQTPLELRNSAMLMTGLLLGLRGVDVVNLKVLDINWKSQCISIIQQKTQKSLILPMPVPVGNSIYRYLKEGRPASDSNSVFLSHVAPYGLIGHSACSEALAKALGNTDHSFHILRRTFATRLLQAGIGTDTIKDSLGHSTTDTVTRYLSISAEGIRGCCLPLNRTVK